MTARPSSDLKAPLRIAQVTTEKGWRGGENQISILLKNLPRQIGGREAEHCVLAPDGSALQSWASTQEIGFYPWAAANDIDLLAALRLKTIADREGIDLIHTHSARAHGLAVMAKRMGGRFKLIVHRRTNFPIATHFLSRWKYLNRGIHHFFAISTPAKDDLVALGVAPERVTVLHSAAAFRPATPDERRAARTQQFAQLGILDPSTTLIAFAGQLEQSKGIFDLVQAFTSLPSSLKVHLAIAGSGPALEQLRLNEKAPNASHHLSLVGFQKDLRPLFAASDIFCLPSHVEGLGTVLLEAIDAGAACCGSRTGGVPEILIDQETGLTFPPGNVATLQAILEILVSQPELRQRLTEAARRHVQKDFSVDGLIAGISKIYTQSLAGLN